MRISRVDVASWHCAVRSEARAHTGLKIPRGENMEGSKYKSWRERKLNIHTKDGKNARWFHTETLLLYALLL